MENANKAFFMAASTLIAVMLFGIFTFFIKNISIWPETEDEILSSEQKTAFNAEYEVYQKTAMYGVDVISCLNKALSNNEKYAEGGSFLSGLAYGDRYLIDVIVHIESPLTESIEFRAMNADHKEVQVFNDSVTVKGENGTTPLKLGDVFEIKDDEMLTSWDSSKELKYIMTGDMKDISDENLRIVEGEAYSLLGDGAEALKNLLAHSTEPRQIVRNKKKNLIFIDTERKHGWSTATWDTFLYSLKQKRFKCETLEYSRDTGLINKIEFWEI